MMMILQRSWWVSIFTQMGNILNTAVNEIATDFSTYYYRDYTIKD